MIPRLVVLTDRSQLPAGRDLVATLARCADAGLRLVVLRELDEPEERRAELAGRLGAHLDVVAAHTVLPGTVGVHLHSTQEPPPTLAGLRGRSCHDPAQVGAAAREGTSYVTVSPVAPSRSKPGYGPALGDAVVRRAVAAAGTVPVLALGGVAPGGAARWRAAGAHGVAVMGAVMRAADPGAVVRELLEEVR